MEVMEAATDHVYEAAFMFTNIRSGSSIDPKISIHGSPIFEGRRLSPICCTACRENRKPA